MSVLQFLASTSGRRDHDLNKELALNIIKDRNEVFVRELVENLNNKNKAIQGDCIKALDEIAMIRADLVAQYSADILMQLKNKNNRMVWGAMAVLDNICKESSEEIFAALDRIMSTLDTASVITRDRGVNILTKLATVDKYYDVVWPLYLEQLEASPVNQFPSYAEWGSQVVKKADLLSFKSIVEAKLQELDQPSKMKRLSKVLKLLDQKFKLK